MSWFKHNGNASFDSRMVALQEALGYFGIGVYWTMVERIEGWGGGIFPRQKLIDDLSGRKADRRRLAQVLDNFGLFVTLESGMVMLRKGQPTPEPTPQPQGEICPQVSGCSEPQRARVYTEEDKTKTTTSSSTTNIKTLKNENIKKSLSDKTSRFAAEMAADRGEWHEMVCMKSGYSTLLHKYWEQAVTQWHQHVISYSTDSDVYSLQRARYYFNSFVKLSTKTGQDLKALLEVMEARATQSTTEADTLPPGAPPRPSPKAIWNPASETWCEFY